MYEKLIQVYASKPADVPDEASTRTEPTVICFNTRVKLTCF